VGYLIFSYLAARQPAIPPESHSPLPGPDGAYPSPAEVPRRSRVNHDAHIFGALTGLAFVLVENPERFQAMLRYFSGGSFGF
jgi:membrane associated rhomboid family serine protease